MYENQFRPITIPDIVHIVLRLLFSHTLNEIKII